MAVRVTVVDPLPLFRQGAAAALSAAGFRVEEPVDLLAWTVRETSAVVLLTLAAERDWRLLEQLRRVSSGTAVIALLDDAETSGIRAIRAGARSVLFRGATADSLRRAVDATAEGQAVLPATVMDALVTGVPAAPDGGAAMTEDQRAWLRRLADGVTVARLADDSGYSERAMYRLLQALYRQLGVETRMQAIMMARDRGWLGG